MVTVFGHSITPKIIPLVYTETQPFEVYNKISRNYKYSFLFESLTGPDELAETSIMGFDPKLILKGYFDRVTIQNRNGEIKTYKNSSGDQVLYFDGLKIRKVIIKEKII